MTQPRLQGEDDGHVDIFSVIRAGDVLVHHPYDSFSTSVERFVEQAANDPEVLAIKMTVYRTSDDTPLVPALIRATEKGKQAVCLVEVKARGDERANIQWARAMEEAGVHVVYGHPALKTHAKCLLVVRREGDGARHYVHIGTGNYHPQTARIYTDFGLFTCDEQIGADVADMFNFLTGYARPRRYRKVLVAPNFLRDGMIAEIERTVAAHEEGKPARIAMKLNSLVDRRCIRALYRASEAGVPVDLNIRGICCLVPGVPGVSENISVNSVVGRFLEHSRIFAFERDGETKVYIGSADLMPRNLDTRVELVTPVDDPALRDDLLDTLERSLADDTNSWDLGVRRRLAPAHAAGPRAALGPARAHARPPGARGRGRHRGHQRLSASSRPRLRCSRHVRSLGLRPRRHRRCARRGRGLRRRRGRRVEGQPRSGPIEGGQMLFGTLLNRSSRPLQLRAADVRVLDRHGRVLSAAAAFAGGYNASIALRGFGTEMFAAATAGPGDGAKVAVAPGATVPLSVSWKGDAAVVEVAGARLTLH